MLPAPLWKRRSQVATVAVDGLEKGKAVIVPGALNRAAAMLYHLAPRRLLLPLLARSHPGLKN